MTPVSKKRYPNAFARFFPSVDLPEAAGPSIAIMFGFVMLPACELILNYPADVLHFKGVAGVRWVQMPTTPVHPFLLGNIS
jgi:hypothetical protein